MNRPPLTYPSHNTYTRTTRSNATISPINQVHVTQHNDVSPDDLKPRYRNARSYP
jgi:hypothetical protein